MIFKKSKRVKDITAPPGEDSTQSPNANSKPNPFEEEYRHSTGKTIAIVGSLMFVAFLMALDRTIIATAIPTITNRFNSLNDVGWYASAYLLTMASFQLLMGRVYTFYNTKWVYLSCIGIFELGSLVCGAAPNSTALIIGRAIAGMGSAGIMSGAIAIVIRVLPLEKRPAFMGAFGAVFAIASVAGPLLGGLFTDKVSWRWCFYINLPVGGVTVMILFFVLHLPQQAEKEKLSLKAQLNQLDPLGTALFMPSIVCFLLALEWGGVTYAWSSARIIVLLTLSGILFIGFVVVQGWRQEFATLPPRILKNRSIIAGVIYSFFSGANMITFVYFLPIWFQAIKNASAVHSGIMNLPAILGLTTAAALAGFGTKKLGYYTTWMYLATVITPIGAGMISTFATDTNHRAWIGYQVLWGIGLGLGMQQPSVAAQTVLAKKDVPTGTSTMFFAQQLGGSVIVSIANNVFNSKLAAGLDNIPGIDSRSVVLTGATELRHVVSPETLPAVLQVYNLALRHAFYVGVAVASATVFGTVLMPWVNLKAVAEEQKRAADARNPEAAPSEHRQVEDEKRIEENGSQSNNVTKKKNDLV